MKKILFSILAVVMILSLFTFSAGAESLATTFEEVYIGEYDSGVHTGECCIIFGTVTDVNAEYGIIITNEEGTSYKFIGKNIGEEGKFGIAIYNMPLGEYTAKVYWGANDSRVFGEEVTISIKPTLVVSNEIANAGDSVTVKITVKNNPGILGMALQVIYDDSVMSLTNAVNGSALSTLTFTKNDNNFVWDGLEITGDDIKDGEVLILTFTVNANAQAGEYAIGVVYDEYAIYDNDVNPIDVAVENGKIIIE